MANEGGTWIMYGVDEDDPYCIHTVEQLIEYIKEIGFLPLFKNEIPGFSVEERTVPHYWWSGDQERDPWEWREIIARSGKVAYGKFFNKKAGFISLEWLPYFANLRRDGYDFDALWDDEKASIRQKKIMDLFEKNEELFSGLMSKVMVLSTKSTGFHPTNSEMKRSTFAHVSPLPPSMPSFNDCVLFVLTTVVS